MRDDPSSETDVSAGQPRVFCTTLWTVVLQAGEGSAESQAALEKLCHAYWYPLYAYVRRQGRSPEEAQDLTQEFFWRLLEKNRLQAADPARGRFRSFLLASLKNFLANEWHRANCQKRGGDAIIFSLNSENAEDRYQFELAEKETPESIYEQRWAYTLLERVMDRLGDEFMKSGQGDRFEELRAFLLDDDAGSQAEIATRLGMTESAVKSAVFRMRQRYGQLLRAEIADTVTSESDIDAEYRDLFASLSGN